MSLIYPPTLPPPKHLTHAFPSLEHVLGAHLTRSDTESDGGSDWDSEDGEYRGPPGYAASRGWGGNGNGRSSGRNGTGRRTDDRGYHSYSNGNGNGNGNGNEHAYDSRQRPSSGLDGFDVFRSSRVGDAHASSSHTRGDRDMTMDRDGGGGGESYEQPRTEGPPPAKQRRRFFRSEMVWNGAELQMKIRSNDVNGVGTGAGAGTNGVAAAVSAGAGVNEEVASEGSAGGNGDKDKDMAVDVDEEVEGSVGSAA